MDRGWNGLLRVERKRMRVAANGVPARYPGTRMVVRGEVVGAIPAMWVVPQVSYEVIPVPYVGQGIFLLLQSP